MPMAGARYLILERADVRVAVLERDTKIVTTFISVAGQLLLDPFLVLPINNIILDLILDIPVLAKCRPGSVISANFNF
ncbi:hypothetical protein BCV73_24280 [Paenibacillus sp. SSG-1]|nr:hypothetical protein BCV73_24280 [Paenibacillus sp. SSG-1]